MALIAGGVLTFGTAGWMIGRRDDALEARNKELSRLSASLQALSVTDPLTGLANRRSLDERLAIEIAEANRYGTTLSLVMMDLDQFKQLNDRHGHLAGDSVLRAVANLLNEEKRRVDLVARYGGEEFLAVLPHTNAEAAAAWAERVRQRLAQTALAHEGALLHLTASFGVAQARPPDDTPERLIEATDMALYEAKRAGRNCVARSDDGTPSLRAPYPAH